MEEDDFINIRPPQATIKSEDKSHRPRISSSKRDRQVFVSSGRRGDERSQNRQYFIWLPNIDIILIKKAPKLLKLSQAFQMSLLHIFDS